jgi:hypothetical protein
VADTAKGTIEAAIAQYQATSPDDLLKEFHTNAKIRGSKKSDKWEKKQHAKGQVKKDMEEFVFSGPFVNKPVQSHETTNLANGVVLFDRSDTLRITKRKGKKHTEGTATWTAVLKEYSGEGWKITHSHFSMEEGFTTP